MVEWFKAHAWKACDVKASAGSNPVLCAKWKFKLRTFCESKKTKLKGFERHEEEKLPKWQVFRACP